MIDRSNSIAGTGLYESSPLPSDSADLTVYLHNELQKIAGVINGILQGGAMPPQYNLPKRVGDGMLLYFAVAIPPTITEAGLWQYRRNAWVKLF